jgi:phage gp36-like protein
VSGVTGVFVCARSGAAEVLGTTASLGVPDVANAKKLKVHLELAPAEALEKSTKDLLDTALKELADAEKARDDLEDELEVAWSEAMAASMAERIPKLRAVQVRQDTELANAQLLATAKSTAADAARLVYDAAADALAKVRLGSAATAASTVGPSAGVKADNIPITTKVTVAGRDEAAIYGGDSVTVEGKAISLTGEDALDPLNKSTVKLSTTKVEIAVGPATVTVSSASPAAGSITIKMGAASIEVSESGITIDGGQLGVKLKGLTVDANADSALKLNASGTISIG